MSLCRGRGWIKIRKSVGRGVRVVGEAVGGMNANEAKRDGTVLGCVHSVARRLVPWLRCYIPPAEVESCRPKRTGSIP